MSDAHRVAVTGLGVITSIGQDASAFWTSLVQARSGIKPIRGFDAAAFTTRIAGEVPEFNPESWIDKRSARRMDRFAQMGIAAAVQAVKDSGVAFDQEDPARCGVIVGTGIGGLLEIEEQHQKLMEKGPDRVSPFLVPKLMSNACSGHISILFGLKGANWTSSSACASSSHSIGEAFRLVKHGYADVMITGGSEAAITPLGLAGFCSAKALSTRNDDPEHASRPFDRDRDGFVMGEGAGIVVLESFEHARRRGARIYAEFLGYGHSGDATHIVEPDATGAGAALAMKAALAEGRVNPGEVDYINAHGTSTLLGDKAETQAIKTALGDAARSTVISSTKSMIGHLLGASGGVEMVATILCMQHNVVHPTANLEHADPACDLDYAPLQPKERPLRKVLSNSFGFGGHNATLLLGRA